MDVYCIWVPQIPKFAECQILFLSSLYSIAISFFTNRGTESSHPSHPLKWNRSPVRATNTNHNEEIKDSVEGVDGVEDIVRANTVLEVVHQEEDNAFQVNVEHDDQVELCHF